MARKKIFSESIIVKIAYLSYYLQYYKFFSSSSLRTLPSIARNLKRTCCKVFVYRKKIARIVRLFCQMCYITIVQNLFEFLLSDALLRRSPYSELEKNSYYTIVILEDYPRLVLGIFFYQYKL